MHVRMSGCLAAGTAERPATMHERQLPLLTVPWPVGRCAMYTRSLDGRAAAFWKIWYSDSITAYGIPQLKSWSLTALRRPARLGARIKARKKRKSFQRRFRASHR